MSVDATTPASTLRTLGELNRTTAKGSNLSQQDFLKILVAQMSNQDPMEPTSNGEFLAQMAQFSLLESFQTLSADFSTSRAYGMIGKYVYIQEPSQPKPVFGKVDGVVNEAGVNYVMVGGEVYNALWVAGVMDAATVENDLDGKILQGASLIGKTVTAAFKDEDGVEQTVTGTVEKLVIQDGQVFAVVGGQNTPISNIREIA